MKKYTLDDFLSWPPITYYDGHKITLTEKRYIIDRDVIVEEKTWTNIETTMSDKLWDIFIPLSTNIIFAITQLYRDY